jgi:hypothetical protein
MGVTITQGQIKKLLKHFNLRPARKGSNVYDGIGKDGILRRCTFHYHKNREELRKGTAESIARQLGFKNAVEMQEYIKKNL